MAEATWVHDHAPKDGPLPGHCACGRPKAVHIGWLSRWLWKGRHW